MKRIGFRAALAVWAAVCLGMSACGGGSGSGSTGADDSAQVTVSVPGTVTAVAGGSQTVSLSFNSSDGRALSDLSVTGGLSAPPAGWSGPGTFACSSVATGNGCLLNLTYAPTVVGSGTLTITYGYQNNAGLARTGTVTIPYAATTDNNVVATSSPTGQINAVVGNGSQAVNVAFTTDDGNAATALSLTTDLSALPSGWSSPSSSFTCASVATGNGCLLALTFTPTAAGSGTLALAYSYLNNAGVAKTGSISIAYASTSHDNVVGTPAPVGQITAVLGGGSRSVAVAFTTDDGSPATNLAITTNLSALPVGWSSASTDFTCNSVSTGNGCLLDLSYAPSSVAIGTLLLRYSYIDDAGSPQTGSVSIPYNATTHDTIVASVSPPGQVSVVTNGSQTVNIAFNTDDGNAATALAVTTDLTMLPAGWRAPPGGFACTLIGSGNGCQLALTYAPTAVASGSLTLAYGYRDNAGTAGTGSVSIPYTATTHDHVFGKVSPSGQVAVITGASSTVSVTFNSDDGLAATAFSADLTGLPAQWSSTPTSLTCASVSTGNGCTVSLTYAPSSVGTGTLTIPFAYTDNGGTAQTGSISVPYTATAHNNINGVASSSSVNVNAATINPVTVTFTTDDGSVATNLSVSTDLTALPYGWSSSSNSFACTSVSTGAGCQLGLTYSPTAGAVGTLTLHFGYTDNAGFAKSGAVNIAYASSGSYFYVTDNQSNTVNYCELHSDGAIANCKPTGSGFDLPFGIAFQGSFAYIANYGNNSVSLCTVGPDGTLSSCASTGNGFTNAIAITFNAAGTLAYVANGQGNGPPSLCTVNIDGTLSACGSAGGGLSNTDDINISADGTRAYVTAASLGTIDLCNIANDGTFSSCAATGPVTSTNPSVAGAFSTTLNGNYLYIAQDVFQLGGAQVCAVNNDGTLPSMCPSTAAGAASQRIFLHGSTAYLATSDGGQIAKCTVANDGTIGSCAPQTTGIVAPWGMAIH